MSWLLLRFSNYFMYKSSDQKTKKQLLAILLEWNKSGWESKNYLYIGLQVIVKLGIWITLWEERSLNSLRTWWNLKPNFRWNTHTYSHLPNISGFYRKPPPPPNPKYGHQLGTSNLEKEVQKHEFNLSSTG